MRCGAIQTASGDFSKESPAIQRELATLKVAKGASWLDGVEANVNDQVKAALAKFAPEVQGGKLTVVGAVYDFADDLKKGNGRLVITNINGETDPARINAIVGESAAAKNRSERGWGSQDKQRAPVRAPFSLQSWLVAVA